MTIHIPILHDNRRRDRLRFCIVHSVRTVIIHCVRLSESSLFFFLRVSVSLSARFGLVRFQCMVKNNRKSDNKIVKRNDGTNERKTSRKAKKKKNHKSTSSIWINKIHPLTFDNYIWDCATKTTIYTWARIFRCAVSDVRDRAKRTTNIAHTVATRSGTRTHAQNMIFYYYEMHDCMLDCLIK